MLRQKTKQTVFSYTDKKKQEFQKKQNNFIAFKRKIYTFKQLYC
jgi:hypothetical protein